MVNLRTENVDKLCVPFGLIIGPCTVLSNVGKLIGDISKMAFNGLLNYRYSPSDAYNNYKAAELAWKQKISARHKPQFTNSGNIVIIINVFSDPEYIRIIESARGTQPFFNYATAYGALSVQDKRKVAFEQSQQDSLQHLTFIAIGIIRTIPVVGGAARWIYNARKAY